MNLDQKNYGLILSADISWRQLMSADRMRSYFSWSKIIFLPKSTTSEKNQLVWATVSWFLSGQLWQSRNLSLDFWWGDAPYQKSGSCPSLIKIGQLIQQLQPNYFSHFQNLKTWTVTKPIIRFRPNFSTSHGKTSSICGSNFIPFYLAVSEIIRLFHFTGPHCSNSWTSLGEKVPEKYKRDTMNFEGYLEFQFWN